MDGTIAATGWELLLGADAFLREIAAGRNLLRHWVRLCLGMTAGSAVFLHFFLWLLALSLAWQRRDVGEIVEEAVRHYLEASAITDLDAGEIAETQAKLIGE